MQDVELGLGGLGDVYSGETRESTMRMTSGNTTNARCARRKRSGMTRKTERVNTDTTAGGAAGGGAPASEHVHAVAPYHTAKPGPSLSR